MINILYRNNQFPKTQREVKRPLYYLFKSNQVKYIIFVVLRRGVVSLVCFFSFLYFCLLLFQAGGFGLTKNNLPFTWNIGLYILTLFANQEHKNGIRASAKKHKKD